MTTYSPGPSGYLARPGGGNLLDVIDTILDKGLVIDAYVRVSVIGIELITIDARIVIASVDTYLRFAEAVNRLDLQREEKDLPELVSDLREGGAKKETEGALEGVGSKVRETAQKETRAVRGATSRRRQQRKDNNDDSKDNEE
jgi:gas vesicle structural protein